jgi:Ca-activated chloride channel homolog
VSRHAAYAVIAIVTMSLCPTVGQCVGVGAQRPSFRGGVDVVNLSVTATDGARRYVTDLDRDDFLVLEDGRPQHITFFRKTGVSLALALLLDTSASMNQSLAIAQEAAIGFVRQLDAGDVAAVIDFDSRVQVRQDFTDGHEALERAIRRTAAGGSTSLYNAVYIALKELAKTIPGEPLGDPRRRAIIVLSDGEDTSSLVSFEQVLDVAARSDTSIYAIGLLGRDPSGIRRAQDAEFVLRRLAQQTGGRAFFRADAKELSGVYGEIRAELSNQYVLAYESNNARRDGQFRRIAVRVERPGVVARTRPGYYAPGK